MKTWVRSGMDMVTNWYPSGYETKLDTINAYLAI